MQRLFNAANLPWASKRSGASASPDETVTPSLYSQVPLLDLVQQAEHMAQLGFWRCDIEAGHVHWSPGVFAIHDLEPTESVAIENALCFYPPNHRPILEAAVQKASLDGTGWDLELDFISARGKKKRVRSIGQAERTNGQITALVGVFQDVSARYAADQKLREAAITDELTGLPNRRHLQQFYKDLQIEKAPRHQVHFALALIDLDHFKPINDSHGHLAGDEVLKQTAKRLEADWLSNSFAARLGGDEFLLLMRDRHLLDRLDATSQKLLEELSQPVQLNAGRVDISATIGIASIEQEAPPLTHLLSAADTMLYAAKHQQRGSCIIARGTDMFLDDPDTFEAIERGATLAEPV